MYMCICPSALCVLMRLVVRLGPNVLQNLPIILFYTATYSHLLFSCILPLFSYYFVFRDLAITAGAGFFSLSRSETTSLCSCWASSSDSELLLLWSFVGVYIPEPQLYELGALVPVLELASIFTPARDVTPFIPSILPIIPALCPSSRAPYYSHFYAGIFGASLLVVDKRIQFGDAFRVGIC